MELKTKNTNLFFDFIIDGLDGLIDLMNKGYSIQKKNKSIFAKDNSDNTDIMEYKSLLRLNSSNTTDKIKLFCTNNIAMLYSNEFDEFLKTLYEFSKFIEISKKTFHYEKSSIEVVNNNKLCFNNKELEYHIDISFNKIKDFDIDSASFLDSYINGSDGSNFTVFVSIEIYNYNYSKDKVSKFEFILGDSPDINKPEDEVMVMNSIAYVAETVINEFKNICDYAYNNMSSYIRSFISMNMYLGDVNDFRFHHHLIEGHNSELNMYRFAEELINGKYITISK